MDDTLATRPMTPADGSAVARLYAHVFGPGQFARTAFRVREANAPDLSLSVVAYRSAAADRLIGAVMMTPITIGEAPALLLGPIAVDDDLQRNGVGARLMSAAVAAADASGPVPIVLVGDPPFYETFGFRQTSPGQVLFPGPVDPARIMLRPTPEGDPPRGPVKPRSA